MGRNWIKITLFICMMKSGEARMCFGCFQDRPLFDDQNEAITKGRKLPPCYFHKEENCTGAENNCVVEFDKNTKTGKINIAKGCTSDPKGCTITNNKNHQVCVCDKRLCNADIVNAGGVYVKGMYGRGRWLQYNPYIVSIGILGSCFNNLKLPFTVN